MTIFEELKAMQKSIYDGNAAKGFWDDGPNRNKGEACMLMITELSEAVEGHRKSRPFPPTGFSVPENNWKVWAENLEKEYPAMWRDWFLDQVKDTYADEIADTVIRLLDTTYGFEWDLNPSDYRKVSTSNFSHDILRITWNILGAYRLTAEKDAEFEGKDWGYVLSAIITFCAWYNIDIVQHVTWKLKYNSTRPPKHGKAY